MIEGLFRKLKPLLGKSIDELWIAYTLGTPEDKCAIEEVVTILAVKHLGMAIGEEKILLDPPPASLISNGEYTVGMIEYPSLLPYPFTLHRSDLMRHVFLLGPSGTGKSTLIIGLLRQFLQDGTLFWSLDWKRNYRCLLPLFPELLVLTVGRSTAPLRVNMLRPPPRVATEEWIEAVTGAIADAYLLMAGARNVLKTAMLDAISEYGDDASLKHVLALLRAELANARSGSRRYGWLESSYRSVEELTKGSLGDALNTTDGQTIEDLLRTPVVFELQGLGDDQKRCFCVYVLQAVLLLRKYQTQAREVLHHVLVFDEAHNVFPKEPFGQLGVPSRLAREVREYGEAIIAATQQADVSESLMANSGVKLFLRADFWREVDVVSRILQVDRAWIPKIPVGYGIARLPTRFYTPFLFHFPEQPIKNAFVSDEAVRERWEALNEIKSEPQAPPVLTEKERALLKDVHNFPISTITERYERLGWNAKTGNTIKDAVLRNQLAVFIPVTTPTGRVKILSLTTAGSEALGETPTKAWRAGGAEHEYWRHVIARLLRDAGWSVISEHLVGDGKSVDLFATRGDRTLVVEIETGHSNIPATIAKCDMLDTPAIIIFTSPADLHEHASLLNGKVTGVATRDLDAFRRRIT